MAAITLNRAERKELITALVMNCDGWDNDDVGILVNMDDDKLWAHANSCAQVVANEDIDESSGMPDTLEPAGAEELQDEAEDDGWEAEQDPGGNQEPKGPTIKQDQEKDQPKVCHDAEGNEIDCPQSESSPGDGAENVTENEYLAYLPPRIRSVVINALRFENAQKAQLVQRITTNQRNRFSEDYLMSRNLDELQALADIAAPQRSSDLVYTGAAGGAVLNEASIDRDDILPVPTLEFNN